MTDDEPCLTTGRDLPPHLIRRKPRAWLVRIEARHFVAGVLVRDGTVVRAAPILRWSLGQPGRRLVYWASGKGHKVSWTPADDAGGEG